MSDLHNMGQTLDLGIEDLETLEAPSYLSGAIGIAVGIAVGCAIVFT